MSQPQKRHIDRSAVLAGLTHVPNRQTDHATSVTIGHICTAHAMWTKTDFTPVILSRNFIVQQSCTTQLCMSHTATLSHKQEMTNQLSQCLFVRQSCCVRHAQL